MSEDTGAGDDEPGVVETRYDWQRTKPSTAIVEAVAAAAACDPVDIDPLFGVTDPDAIDALVASSDRTQDAPLSVSVRLDEYDITVGSDGVVTVSDAPTEASP